MNFEKLVPQILNTVRYASSEINKIYLGAQDLRIKYKSDQSPVTIADKLSHQIIVNDLKSLTPNIPVLSEEDEHLSDFETRKTWKYYWIIDPLDGTKEFIAGSEDFSINIALIHNHKPVLGVVGVPMHFEYYWATQGGSAYYQSKDSLVKKISCQPASKVLRITASRTVGKGKKMKSFLNKLDTQYDLQIYGSTYKICLIARGDADLYPRFGPTSEWDTAAGQCILECAGGKILSLPEFIQLRYNEKPSLINPEFIALGDVELSRIKSHLISY